MASFSATSTMSYEDSLSSQYLSSSISSLSSARSQSSLVARTYRQAAQLFLTRRLYEALATIEPIVSAAEQEGSGLGRAENGQRAAPVAGASRTTRIKVWSFYLTLLNSIIELGPEEGKLLFGSSKWRALADKARQGTAWEEVIRLGYGDDEGAVDGEVVVNLATLLLAHMPSQRLNQQRLETYLSAASNPYYDVAAHMEHSQNSTRSASPSNNGGTSTPRDLNTRLKLLELYTLHVLPQNEEWDYARDFINMSEVLDEERRDAFLQALQTIKEERAHDAIREKELRKRQEEEMQQRQQEDERRRREEAKVEEERRRRQASPAVPPTNAAVGRDKETSSGPSKNGQGSKPLPSRKRVPQKAPPTPPPGTYKRVTSLFAQMQSSMLHARQSLTNNPLVFFRFLFFLVAFLVVFGRRDIRERLKRMFGDSWDRVRRTVGMGVKVSYI